MSCSTGASLYVVWPGHSGTPGQSCFRQRARGIESVVIVAFVVKCE
jgi:hypothetical protein